MTREWSVTSSPQVARLNGVESGGEIAYTAGDRGVLFERAGESQWTAVFTAGPDGDGRNLFDPSLTAGGRRVWFAGVAGTQGVYDRSTDTVETHHEPSDISSTFRSVSVHGEAGSETVHAADDNGEILRATVEDGEFRVRGVVIPGGGTAFAEVVDNDEELFAADAAGTSYHTTDGRHWKRRRLADTPVRAITFDSATRSRSPTTARSTRRASSSRASRRPERVTATFATEQRQVAGTSVLTASLPVSTGNTS